MRHVETIKSEVGGMSPALAIPLTGKSIPIALALRDVSCRDVRAKLRERVEGRFRCG